MKYKLFGRCGLRVSELALGTMTFGEEWGWGASKQESKRVFDLYAEAGGNFIDTANRYTNGTSESYVGEFIASDREHFVVATKYSLYTRHGDPNFCGNHRKNLVQALDASLRRLNTEYIDLYWVHAWDFTTAVDEVLRALDDAVRSGKVLHIGVSDTPAWIVSQANTIAELRGWTRFAGLQIRYSLLDRTAERDLLPMARSFELAVTPWSVLGAGVLTGKYNSDPAAKGRAALSKPVDDEKLRIAAVVGEIANENGCTPAEVAINWVRQQPGIIIPLIGARSAEQLQSSLDAVNTSLTPGQIVRLSEATAFPPGFPHDFLESDGIRDIVYAGTYSDIINHRMAT